MDKKIQRKPWYKRNLPYLILSLFLVVTSIYFLFFKESGSTLKIDESNISIAKVKSDIFKDFIYINGAVEPLETILLDATEGGRVEKIFKEEGEFLRKGDPILQLSNDKLALQISNNEAQVERAINDLEQTEVTLLNQDISSKNRLNSLKFDLQRLKRNLERNEILYKKQFISKEALETSRESYLRNLEEHKLLLEKDRLDSIFRTNKFGATKKSINRMNGNLNLTRNRLDKLTLKSPINGELSSLIPKIGQVINYGTRIGVINVLDSYKIKVEIDEFYISRIRKGQKGISDFSGEKFKVLISKVYPEVIEGKFFVDMSFEGEAPENIRIGQNSRIELQLGEPKKSILLSVGSFFSSTGGNWVYVLSKDKSEAIKKTIKLGRKNADYFEVLEGLNEGEEVITSSYDTYNEIDKILLN